MPRVALLPVCVDVTELVTAYQDRALSWRERMSINWHLRHCEPCTRFYDQMRRTAALMRDRALFPPDPAAIDTVLRAGPPDTR